MIFSDKLQIIRKAKGITQEELADKLGVSRQAIAKWESGMAYPDITNLIQLSNLFHITIDYLVKDNDCGVSVKTGEDADKGALIAFRAEAIRNTYAGHAECCESSRLCSHDYSYESGEYKYYDTWLGGEKFTGEEAVWKDGIPIYSMNYFGRTLDERFSGDFLKEALSHSDEKFLYRGPEFYQSGEYIYKTRVIGDIEWFQGYEEIFCEDIKVYECNYHGGMLV